MFPLSTAGQVSPLVAWRKQWRQRNKKERPSNGCGSIKIKTSPQYLHDHSVSIDIDIDVM